MRGAGAPPEPLTLLLFDPDEERGAKTASCLIDCGFPAAATRIPAGSDAASPRKAAILAVEISALHGAPPPDHEAAPLEPEEVREMATACGAAFVVAWMAVAPPDRTLPKPAWADDLAVGLPELIGRVALLASDPAREPLGELARTRARIDEARRIVHDLSQPLTTIVARSRLLLESMGEKEGAYRPVSIIASEADRLAESIDRIKAVLPPRRKV